MEKRKKLNCQNNRQIYLKKIEHYIIIIFIPLQFTWLVYIIFYTSTFYQISYWFARHKPELQKTYYVNDFQ